MTRRVPALVVVLIGVLAAPGSAGERVRPVSGPITVFAASSLTEAFTDIADRFEARNPDAEVTLSFGSSSTLATQIEQGAPVDVFASADVATMDRLIDGGHVADGGGPEGEHLVFTRNRLAIAVAPGNPKKIETLADTLSEDVTLVLCAPEVPCGKYALQVYDNAGLTVPTVPTGASARDTLAKVTLGEADAAIVYVTDIKAAASDVDGVTIPADANVVADYQVAPVDAATNEAGAKAFILYVQSKAGQKTLRKLGFRKP